MLFSEKYIIFTKKTKRQREIILYILCIATFIFDSVELFDKKKKSFDVLILLKIKTKKLRILRNKKKKKSYLNGNFYILIISQKGKKK